MTGRKAIKREENVMVPVKTIQFDNKNDGDLLQLINNYASIFNEKVMLKIAPRNAIRNFLINELPKAISKLNGNGEQV